MEIRHWISLGLQVIALLTLCPPSPNSETATPSLGCHTHFFAPLLHTRLSHPPVVPLAAPLAFLPFEIKTLTTHTAFMVLPTIADDLQLDSHSNISAVLKPREAPALVLHVSVPALPVLKTLKVPLLEMDSLATLYSKLATLLAIDVETLKISIPGVTLEALKKNGVAKALEASRTEKGCIALLSIAGEPPRDYLRVEVHLPSGFHDSIGGVE